MAISSTHTSADWAHYTCHSKIGVQLLDAHFLTHKFERHSHSEFSIGVTHSGVQSFHARGAVHHSQPQNIMVFNPDVMHDGMAGHATGFGYQMVYIEPELIASWCHEYFADHAMRYVRQPLMQDAGCAARLHLAFIALKQTQESLRAYNLLSQGVLQLLSRHGGTSDAQALFHDAPTWIRNAQDYMQANYAKDVTADDMAAVAGVSRTHFNRVFTQAVGTPPHVYLNTVRIRHAQQQLRKGQSAIDVAANVGFADQSHLIRRFKGFLGITPKQWQEENTK
jgi:AraC-like DNA-binding protein